MSDMSISSEVPDRVVGVDGGGWGGWGWFGWMGWFGEKVEKVLGKCIATSLHLHLSMKHNKERNQKNT